LGNSFLKIFVLLNGRSFEASKTSHCVRFFQANWRGNYLKACMTSRIHSSGRRLP
uniref:Ovule protein n=1 Tax=Ascaris lumbricoides TaxID=6252 RepID=A0A0M3IL62_ASCLU